MFHDSQRRLFDVLLVEEVLLPVLLPLGVLRFQVGIRDINQHSALLKAVLAEIALVSLDLLLQQGLLILLVEQRVVLR